MKVTAVIENTVFKSRLEAEHGLSLLVENGTQRLLIDCGQTDACMRNLRRLHLRPGELSAAVITHGHYDHTGGLAHLADSAPELPIYLSERALEPKFRDGIYIGIPKPFLDGKYVSVSEPVFMLDENTYFISSIEQHFPADTATAGFTAERNGNTAQDAFEDEIAIAVKYAGGLAVISGCSHTGATNIIETVQQRMQMPVTAFIGGLHLQDATSGEKIDHIARYFNRSSIRHIVTGHCTGIASYAELRSRCTAQVDYISTGKTIEIVN